MIAQLSSIKDKSHHKKMKFVLLKNHYNKSTITAKRKEVKPRYRNKKIIPHYSFNQELTGDDHHVFFFFLDIKYLSFFFV